MSKFPINPNDNEGFISDSGGVITKYKYQKTNGWMKTHEESNVLPSTSFDSSLWKEPMPLTTIEAINRLAKTINDATGELI